MVWEELGWRGAGYSGDSERKDGGGLGVVGGSGGGGRPKDSAGSEWGGGIDGAIGGRADDGRKRASAAGLHGIR